MFGYLMDDRKSRENVYNPAKKENSERVFLRARTPFPRYSEIGDQNETAGAEEMFYNCFDERDQVPPRAKKPVDTTEYIIRLIRWW